MSYSNYISKKQVARILGVSTSSVIRWVKTNNLPKPFKFGSNTLKWDITEIEKWIEERKNKRGFLSDDSERTK